MGHRNPGALFEKGARISVEYPARHIGKRPEFAERLSLRRVAAQQSRSDAEQDSTTFSESIRFRVAPRMGGKQWEPAIFQSRQVCTLYASRYQTRRNCL